MAKINKTKKSEIIIYKGAKGPELEVKVGADSVWLSQAQLAQLFSTERSVITKHIKNVFASGELNEKSNVQKMHFASSDKPVKLYSLDLIISVGYRVNSKRATQFRIWATNILKEYLTAGYAVNQKLLSPDDKKFLELKRVIKFIETKSENKLLKNQAQELMSLLSSYAKSLTLLDKYDHGKLTTAKNQKAIFIINYNDSISVIKAIKKDLISKGEASELFGKEVDDKFEAAIKNLYQTYNKKPLYTSLEEKAANLLYLIIKDHPFVDGNKRIGAFLFVYFLDRNNYLFRENGDKRINDGSLTSLALLVAASDPREKDIIIKIITNLLQ